MKIIILALILFTVTAAAPRCHVTTVRGRTYLVCPCRGVSYVCEDWYSVPRGVR